MCTQDNVLEQPVFSVLLNGHWLNTPLPGVFPAGAESAWTSTMVDDWPYVVMVDKATYTQALVITDVDNPL